MNLKNLAIDPALPGTSVDKKQKRRLETEARLLASVGTILAQRGVEGLGVNALAAEAGVDKALIYRYFGDWGGLLRAYGQSTAFWPTLDELLGPEREVLRASTLGEVAVQIVVRHERALRSRPATIAILRWECSQQNELTQVLAEAREARSVELRDAVLEVWPDAHPLLSGLTVLLSAAMSYLIIRSHDTPVYGGLELRTEPGWASMEALVGGALHVVDSVVSQRRPRSE